MSFSSNSFVIYRCVIGSRAYGLEHADSDTDRRGIYLPPADLQWSLDGVPDHVEDPDTQDMYWELKKFLLLALAANPNVLECLYSPIVEHITPLGEQLLSIRHAFLSKRLYQTYNGYSISQFKKVQADLRNLGEVKWKHVMHLLRLLISGIAALNEGVVPVRVDEHRKKLLSIRRGEVRSEEIEEWRAALQVQFESAFAKTALPDEPDYAVVNAFLIEARRSVL